MIRQLRGTVAHATNESVVVDVNGVGYHVHVSEAATQFPLGSTAIFHTHLAVRENALDLYGFSNLDMLEVFELLITLPKIGPKSAQQILRQADISLLKEAVRNEDATYLSKMSGIGKKSAEKIVAGLKDKLADMEFGSPRSGTTDPSYASDTIDALVALGYSHEDARKSVRTVSESDPDIATSPEALKAALKLLSK